jgi:hypothetical protein
MDIDLSLERLKITRGMAWSERVLRNNGVRKHRQSDEERIKEVFDDPAEDLKMNGVAPFLFDAEVKRHADSLRLVDGLYL